MALIDLFPRITVQRLPCDNTGFPILTKGVRTHHTGQFYSFEWLTWGIVLWGGDYKPPLK